jgi:hypothetical protein
MRGENQRMQKKWRDGMRNKKDWSSNWIDASINWKNMIRKLKNEKERKRWKEMEREAEGMRVET